MPRFRNPVVSTADIADGSITTPKLADGAVATAKLANLAVATGKLADLAVVAAKLADSSVTTTKIANLAVGTAAIADAAITTAKIANLAVSSATIATAAIGSAKIADVLESDNWDGTTVAAQDATQGWRIERDTGNIGIENLFARGDLYSGTSPDQASIIDGVLKLESSGDSSITIDPGSAGLLGSPEIEFYADGIQIGRVYGQASGGAAHSMVYSALNGAEHIFAGSDVWISNNSFKIIGDVGKSDLELTDQGVIAATGLATNVLPLSADLVTVPDGGPAITGLAFDSDHDTGIGLHASNRLALITGGENRLTVDHPTNSGFRSGAIRDATTSASQNMRVSSVSGQVKRITSSAEYKRQITDWRPRERDWDALRVRRWESNIAGEKGQVFRGFVLEELPGVFRGDGLEDLRSIVAALVARVKALEAAA